METLIKRPSAVNCLDRINNTTVSPFASRPGERIVHCEYPEKSKYISQYSITETQKLVLKAVEEMLFCTSKLIMAKLDTMNIDVDPKKVRNAIDKLFDGGYLHKILFSDGTSRSSYRVYFLSFKKGGCLFRSIFGRFPKKVIYAENAEVSTIKKYLAINQYMINVQADPFMERGQVIEKKGLFSNIPLRVAGSAKNGNTTVFFEAIRRSDDEKNVIEKAERYAKFLRSNKNITPVIDGNINLIVIAEDSEHAKEASKLLRKVYRGLNVTFTYDTAIFDSSDCVELEQAAS